MCCPVSPVCLAEGKHSDCSKGYLTRGENIPAAGIVWRGVMAPLQAFNSRPDKHLAREADRARGGSDRPALSPYSFMVTMSPDVKCRCEDKPSYWCGQTEVLHRLQRQQIWVFLNLYMCAVLFDRSPRPER